MTEQVLTLALFAAVMVVIVSTTIAAAAAESERADDAHPTEDHDERSRPPFRLRCYGPAMAPDVEARRETVEPAHVPSGAELLAIELSQVARGIRGLDVLRRSVDRAPPA